VLLALLVRRRPVPPPTGRWRRAGIGVVLAAVAATALISGVIGLVVLATILLIGRIARSRAETVVLSVLALALGAGLMAVAGVDDGQTGLQMLAVVTLASLVASLTRAGRELGRSGTSDRTRRIGRSTAR
jgi:hypothetical protein